ncbi:MAG: methylated-DNA--[protein]-cysteine S-methyltransferase [Syntrophomonadaceae bacterium]|nr:methylated-DNA--[protein]-cysteine S-methyltransferase [Syntrophomonadaceae bacterium]
MVFIRETSIGKVGIAEEDGYITRLYLPTDNIPQDSELPEPPVIQQAFAQLELYLSGNLQEFTLPLKPEGTSFMQRVWQKLLQVPYGQTASYKDIAAAVGSPLATRAVGQANHRNPIPIFIPCHRIIGSQGDLVGYGGGLEMKRTLLRLEGCQGKGMTSVLRRKTNA